MRWNPACLVVSSLAFTLALTPALNAQSAPAAAPVAPSAQPGRGAARPGGFREPDPRDFSDHSGYISLFDGKDLKGWEGDPSVWSVQDGAITGVTTLQHRAHTYLVYRGLQAKDFDLKLEIKAVGGGTGIQYRSLTGIPWRRPDRNLPAPNLTWMMTGPQADFWSPNPPRAAVYTGQFYVENSPLGIVAWRGEVVQIEPGKAPRLVGTIGDRDALGGYVKVNDWNQYLIMARGGTFIQILNGQLMSLAVDDDAHDVNNRSGMIGIEIEGAPSTISVRDIWIKKFD